MAPAPHFILSLLAIGQRDPHLRRGVANLTGMIMILIESWSGCREGFGGAGRYGFIQPERPGRTLGAGSEPETDGPESTPTVINARLRD